MPSAFELVGVADAGQLEQLRRVDRAAAEDHLGGAGVALQPAGAQVVDADRPLAVEDDPGARARASRP